MGQSCSHMNLWALSCILRMDIQDLESIYKIYEERFVSDRLKPLEITEEDFLSILSELHIHFSDVAIFNDIFCLLDTKNRGISNIRDVLISMTPLLANSVQQMLTYSFNFMDRQKTQLIQKHELQWMLSLLNGTCANVGDKSLSAERLDDYINSVYTSAGKIDGEIFYPNYLENFYTHPIIYLLLSPQFQGSVHSKLMTEKQINDMFSYLDE
jgi:Ca2+-binding EF-hand superfamily protein